MPINFPLGWNNPSGSVLTGPDAPSLRRIFESLQQWLTFPVIGLEVHDAIVPNGGIVLGWSTEILDEYQLHDANGTTIRVPSAFNSYLAIGVVGALFAVPGGTEVSVSWRVNGVNTLYSVLDEVVAPLSFEKAIPFMKQVFKGQTISVNCFQNSGAQQADNGFELWLAFLPMGS